MSARFIPPVTRCICWYRRLRSSRRASPLARVASLGSRPFVRLFRNSMWRNFMRHVMSILAMSIAVGLSAPAPAMAQQGTGELRGRVLDQQSAVLPGVAVVARNEGSGMFREIVSGADGSFFMSGLAPG